MKKSLKTLLDHFRQLAKSTQNDKDIKPLEKTAGKGLDSKPTKEQWNSKQGKNERRNYHDMASKQKGVRKPAANTPGFSAQHHWTADSRKNPAHAATHAENNKTIAHDNLKDLKGMRKIPTLGKSEHATRLRSYHLAKQAHAQRGVRQQAPTQPGSSMDRINGGDQKDASRRNLAELKQMPVNKLACSENKHEKGVHQPLNSAKPGQSLAGKAAEVEQKTIKTGDTKHGMYAWAKQKEEHAKNYKDLKGMRKVPLTKGEAAGRLRDHHLGKKVAEGLQKEDPTAMIGQTKVGHPVFANAHPNKYPHFTAQDHKDAANVHFEHGSNIANNGVKMHHTRMAAAHMNMAFAGSTPQQPATQAPPVAPPQRNANPMAQSKLKSYVDIPGKRRGEDKP